MNSRKLPSMIARSPGLERIVIGSFAGGLAELRESGMRGIDVLAPITAESVADAIEYFANLNVEECRLMAKVSRESVEFHHSPQRVGALYKDLVESLDARG